jgi:hypothetical protein
MRFLSGIRLVASVRPTRLPHRSPVGERTFPWLGKTWAAQVLPNALTKSFNGAAAC